MSIVCVPTGIVQRVSIALHENRFAGKVACTAYGVDDGICISVTIAQLRGCILWTYSV